MTNAQAHQTITMLEGLFDVYNDTGFIGENETMLKVYQGMVQESLHLLKFLETKESNNEALIEYLSGARKVSLRLSSLIHNGRKETDEEKYEFLSIYQRGK